MAIKVLIVLDDDFRFDDDPVTPGFKDFTYKALVEALTDAGMLVTRAHRGADSTADIAMFDFSTATLSDYDVIWLIGLAGRNQSGASPSGSSTPGGLGAAQHDAIAAFMEQGGGVFATGDHDSIGADMAGHLPRVRAMRAWFGVNDGARPPELASLPANFPPTTEKRADTTRPNPAGSYTFPGIPAPYVWFENQSDSVPQPIVPVSPTHPILKRGDADILVYPDHMHEGQTLGEVAGHGYDVLMSPFGDTSKLEFRDVAGHRELPRVIATGKGLANANYTAENGSAVDSVVAAEKEVNTLSVYDGRVAGVGRIVTGSTFHHYVDINLTGDFDIVPGDPADRAGTDAIKGNGFNSNPAVFADIKAVFVNITTWLAPPRPAIQLILERSTFSQDEAPSGQIFAGAVLVTVDGLKPSQFPGGGPSAAGPIDPMAPPPWAPVLSVPMGAQFTVEPIAVSSDDPGMPDRVQRFTFKYRVRFTGNAFTFGGPTSTVPVQAVLDAPLVSASLSDSAWFQLVKSANPFMLDLEDDSAATWLSSDVKVFHVVEGGDVAGVTLPIGADRAAALAFLNSVADSITSAQFTALPSAQTASTLSPVEFTTGMPPKRVYNFALARVRLNGVTDADPVRVFFRMFTTQTTAALTYRLDGMGNPIEGYLKSAGPDRVALPGTHLGGTEWLSFPFFAEGRASPQSDGNNAQKVEVSKGFKIFGALLDNNLPDPYLTQTPVSGGPLQSLPSLLIGEHQCLIAQIEFATAPIPDGATPWTSDKLSQRNIAMSSVANPGLDASRTAFHSFECEATPQPITEAMPPDEFLLDWSERTPEGTLLRLHVPGWSVAEVVELADRLYPRHEIVAVDAETIELPGGGTRYVPIPRSLVRRTGVVSVELPLGIKKGERFDVSIRQVTNRFRRAQLPPPKVTRLTLEEAARLIDAVPAAAAPTRTAAGLPRGAFDLGNNRTLFTDLSYFDAVSDHALVIEHPDPALVAAAAADAGQWRETIGAFQLGIPVSTREEMRRYHAQLLSVMRWRAEHLARNSRWRRTMDHYLALLTGKVQALGVDPWTIPATPDGAIPPLKGDEGEGGPPVVPGGGGGDTAETLAQLRRLVMRLGCGLLLLVLLILWLFWYLLLR